MKEILNYRFSVVIKIFFLELIRVFKLNSLKSLCKFMIIYDRDEVYHVFDIKTLYMFTFEFH